MLASRVGVKSAITADNYDASNQSRVLKPLHPPFERPASSLPNLSLMLHKEYELGNVEVRDDHLRRRRSREGKAKAQYTFTLILTRASDAETEALKMNSSLECRNPQGRKS